MTPITNQPRQSPSGWTHIPRNTLDCTPGLEYLSTIDQVLVHQKNKAPNEYEIKNISGQTVYHAVEDSDCCDACALSNSDRPFDMRILDNHENEVIHLSRLSTCCESGRLEVFAPPGYSVGMIEQECSMPPKFSIKNASGDTIFRIKRPFLDHKNFKIMSADGVVQVGLIKKKWSGLLGELFTDADNFGISFPMDLEVRMKAVMLGACILIDMIYFED